MICSCCELTNFVFLIGEELGKRIKENVGKWDLFMYSRWVTLKWFWWEICQMGLNMLQGSPKHGGF